MNSQYSSVVLLLIAALGLISSVDAADASTPKDQLPLKFFIFREDCFDLFFNKFDFFSNQECLKLTISKAIGYGIIAGSAVLKLPQIIKILNNRSVEGIAKSLFYIEIVMLINTSAISIAKNIPFSVYGESLIILMQNFIIVLLFWVYSKDIGVVEKLFLFLFFSGYSYVLIAQSNLIDANLWEIIGQSNMLLLVLSRVPQIITNFQNKSTGQLAFVTFLLGFLGGVARLGTVLVETDDFLYQLQFIVGVTLAGIIVLQFIMYWNNDAKVAPNSKLESKSKKPDSSPRKTSRAKID